MLNTAGLKSDLAELAGGVETAADAAGAWADAYASYASDAFAAPLTIVPAGVEAGRATLRTALLGVFSNLSPGRTSAQAAEELQAALTAFWYLPPQTFAGSGTGLITLVPPTLSALLQTVFAANMALVGESGQKQAVDSIASAIDAWTRTIVATVTIPPGGPAPVPLT